MFLFYIGFLNRCSGFKHQESAFNHASLPLLLMTTINLPHLKTKLRDVSGNLFLDRGSELPKSLNSYGDKNRLNFILAKWQQGSGCYV